MKILFIVIDGLGDRPIPQFGNKTPLEAARTPSLDWLAGNGICGLVKPAFYTTIPTSEESHFSLFGYDPKVYQVKRGMFTAMGAGMKMRPGDIALRGNFGTIDKNFNMIDRRAGRISKTQPLIEVLDGTVIDGVKFLIRAAGGYRIGIIMRGKSLSSNISDGDPHYGKLGKRAKKIVSLDKSSRARFTAQVLNKFLAKSRQILKNHPLNKKRERVGLPPANYILTRGASPLIKLPSFKKKYGLKACCIAGKILYKQIGETLGMNLIRVSGADGSPTTNLRGKFLTAKNAFKKYNFIFLHIKAADSLAEDGNFRGKKDFIEKIDKNFKPLLELKDILIVVTADHSTCCALKRHCSEPVPILIYPPKFCKAKLGRVYGGGSDNVKKFSEKSCKKGKLGRIKSLALMPKLMRFYRK